LFGSKHTDPQFQPWNKVTGEIYPEAVEYWKPFDLSHYITSNWANAKNLGEVLRGRIFVYVGSHDNYYLNEGVECFQQNVDSYGGAGWVSQPPRLVQNHKRQTN
jgi:hypothetical protein